MSKCLPGVRTQVSSHCSSTVDVTANTLGPGSCTCHLFKSQCLCKVWLQLVEYWKSLRVSKISYKKSKFVAIWVRSGWNNYFLKPMFGIVGHLHVQMVKSPTSTKNPAQQKSSRFPWGNFGKFWEIVTPDSETFVAPINYPKTIMGEEPISALPLPASLLSDQFWLWIRALHGPKISSPARYTAE